MRSVIAVVAVSLISVLPAAAATCPGKAQFQDSFAKVNTSWDMGANDTTKVAVQGGKFVANILAGGQARAELYQGDFYDDVNVCVTVHNADADKADNQSAGVAFWAKDYTSYYVFVINAAGQIGVHRLGGGRWIHPLALQDSAAVKKGAGQSNSVRVQLKADQATFFVNDQQVGTIQGHPVDGGSLAGFYAESSSSSADTWEFTDFAVAKP